MFLCHPATFTSAGIAGPPLIETPCNPAEAEDGTVTVIVKAVAGPGYELPGTA